MEELTACCTLALVGVVQGSSCFGHLRFDVARSACWLTVDVRARLGLEVRVACWALLGHDDGQCTSLRVI
jgi:hypothetical protein